MSPIMNWLAADICDCGQVLRTITSSIILIKMVHRHGITLGFTDKTMVISR